MIVLLEQLDLAIRSWVVLHRVAALDAPMLALSAAGRLGLIWLVSAVALAAAKRIAWRDVGRLALALIIGTLLTDYTLKPIVNRPRPFVVSPAVAVIGHRPHDASFPSGHATASFVSAVVLTKVAPALSPLWWVLAVGISYSRVYLGVHYPLDVLAGAAIGSAVAALVLTLTKPG